MSDSGLFSRFFRTDEDDRFKKENLDYWKAALEFRQLAYYDRLMAWITEEALRPVKPGDSQNMVISAARQNAFLEVRKHILDDIKNAEVFVRAENG